MVTKIYPDEYRLFVAIRYPPFVVTSWGITSSKRVRFIYMSGLQKPYIQANFDDAK